MKAVRKTSDKRNVWCEPPLWCLCKNNLRTKAVGRRTEWSESAFNGYFRKIRTCTLWGMRLNRNVTQSMIFINSFQETLFKCLVFCLTILFWKSTCRIFHLHFLETLVYLNNPFRFLVVHLYYRSVIIPSFCPKWTTDSPFGLLQLNPILNFLK